MKRKAEAAIKQSKNSVEGYRFKGQALVELGQANEANLTEALQWVNQGIEALSKAMGLCTSLETR